jgi:hypothetical protein
VGILAVMTLIEQKINTLTNQVTVMVGCLELGETSKAIEVGRAVILNLRSLAQALTSLGL